MKKALAISVLSAVCAVFVAGPAAAATNDTYRAKQWGLNKIQAEAAWTTSDGTGAIIAVVDSGVDMGHPDLDGKLLAGRDFVDGGTPQDENGHGTHVAGIAAAETNNSLGVAGTAPGAQILPVRVLDAEGSGSTGAVADGIRYAADQGADFILPVAGHHCGSRSGRQADRCARPDLRSHRSRLEQWLGRRHRRWERHCSSLR